MGQSRIDRDKGLKIPLGKLEGKGATSKTVDINKWGRCSSLDTTAFKRKILKSYVVDQTFLHRCEDGSYKCGSKLRATTQTGPRVASKWVVSSSRGQRCLPFAIQPGCIGALEINAAASVFSETGQGLDLGTGGSQVRNPILLKIRRVWGLLHAKSYVVAKRPPVGVARKFGDGGASSGAVLVI
ncbi:hypothetical protein AVEN_176267-1 [Araneus ventricosus]|uniref:Uncharacterized protein n=1 Tax=Araneus ventricosus TaxID=182803 RepID=A0A4Y2LE44_ARAVE|nr:hypothetical protein AVEN_176267-1 [Araneus ventricosus]